MVTGVLTFLCLTGAVVRSFLVLLLLVSSCAKLRCNYKDILGSYREVILVELQSLNLTDASNATKVRDHCPSEKERRILASIYALTQQLRCQRGRQQQWDLEQPVESMEQLISQKCSAVCTGKRVPCSAWQKIRGKKRKRIRVVNTIKAIITCWQKLQTIYSRRS